MVIQYIDDFVDRFSDPRLKGTHSIMEPTLIIVSYLLIVRKIGPWFMKNREPYNIKNFVMLFDAIQVVLNVYLVIQDTIAIQFMTGSYFCLDVDSSESYEATRCLFLTKFYYWLKISDLLDTMFSVLRKSWRQVNYLHIYHHSIMVLLTWMAVKFAPGGQLAYFGIANSTVHAFMYLYYLMSAYDPTYKKNLRVKKMITQIQLIQFVFIFIMYLPSLQNSCTFPKILSVPAVTQAVYFLYLFGKFYYHNYIETANSEQKKVHKTR